MRLLALPPLLLLAVVACARSTETFACGDSKCVKGRESCNSVTPGMLPAGQTTVPRSGAVCTPLPPQCIDPHAECACFGRNMSCQCTGSDGALGVNCVLP